MAKKIDKPDYSEVESLIEEYLERVKDKESTSDELSDYDSAVFEACLEALYGKAVWEEINPYLEEK